MSAARAHQVSASLKRELRSCRYGTVENVRLRNLPIDIASKMPKQLQIKAGKVDASRGSATAFVRFAAREEASAALAANMSVVDGAHVRVDLAAAPSSKKGAVQYEPKRSVFVGNLAFDTKARVHPQRLLLQVTAVCEK